jgi:hypothetical protein
VRNISHKDILLKLWEWLLAAKKQKKKDLLPPEKAFAYVFFDKKFNDAKWRHLQSQLSLQIEQFLVERVLQKKPLEQDLHLVPVLRQKNLNSSLNRVFIRAENRLSKLPRDRDYYHLKYQIESEKYAAIDSMERVGKKNLTHIGESLDVYLVSSKLRLACLMESHRVVSNIDYDTTFLPEILAYIEEGSTMLEIPIIALYYHCYKSLIDGKESNFRAFRKVLQKEQQEISLEERTTFLLLAINFCIKQLNTGEERYIRESFDLYQTGLATKALLSDGHLSRFAFKNIVALGLKLKEFGWVKMFIGEYAGFIIAEYREAHRNYNLARLYFTTKEFDKAMPMLAQIDDSDLLLNLDSRVMLLKMYYEMGELEALDNLLASFRILLLRKKKIIGYHQKHYLNMLRYIKKLANLNPYDREAVKKFKMQLTNDSEVVEREWIFAQI